MSNKALKAKVNGGKSNILYRNSIIGLSLMHYQHIELIFRTELVVHSSNVLASSCESLLNLNRVTCIMSNLLITTRCWACSPSD